jgi:hypothetical protein
MHDYEAYNKFPQHRKWFNKLWLSEKLDYYCGPAGIAPNISQYYIVRPIMNLSGMSLNASKTFIESGDLSKVQPGYFWCEFFEGKQHSVSYQYSNSSWLPFSSYEGFRDEENLYKFKKWIKTDWYIELPNFIDELKDVSIINVEFIDNKIIELHLRDTPDPLYNELIPIWESNKNMIDKYVKIGYNYIDNYDDADGFLKNPRLGFMIK